MEILLVRHGKPGGTWKEDMWGGLMNLFCRKRLSGLEGRNMAAFIRMWCIQAVCFDAARRRRFCFRACRTDPEETMAGQNREKRRILIIQKGILCVRD